MVLYNQKKEFPGGIDMIDKKEIHTDVLVLGSGPSGFAAAYTAAKNGA